MALTCLDTLVGLSATDYACFTGDAPDGFDTSASGYYLTDTDYGLTIAEQCTVDGWAMLAAARTQAIREFKTDLRAMLRQEYNGPRPFVGLIGQLKSSGLRTVTDDYIGFRIRVRKMQKGAKLVIRKIYLGVDTSATFSVLITSNDPLFVAPDPVDIDTTANTFSNTVLDTAIELPFWSEACPDEYLEYYFLTARASAKPMNNSFKCCGSTPAWTGFVWADGMASTDTDAEENGGNFGSHANGFALDAYLTCEELDWICNLEYLNGYSVLDVVARTIQFRGAALAISSMIDTIQVNPCTGYQLEALNTKRAYLNKRYSENIAWITQNLPAGLTDCFACKPEKIFHKAQMLV